MKRLMTIIVAGLTVTMALSACGGGGGGSSPVSSASTKLLVFGHMTSLARLATVQATMTIPTSIQVNYSSAPGAISGLCKLRKGVITPSGTVLVSADDFSGSTYDIASRILTINMVNSGQVALKSSDIANSGKGAEIATLQFKLTTPGTLPTTMPLSDATATISQQLPGPSVTLLPGALVNYLTTYQ
jgi:hypothetical protein